MKKGFTLVELVIVIAIVIVLSVVSVPIYRSYVDKAKLAEGYALMGTLFSAQKAYYSEYGIFYSKSEYDAWNVMTSYDPILGIDARGNKYFSLFNAGRNIGNGSMGNGFDVHAVIPEEIRPAGKTWLRLRYFIQSGLNTNNQEGFLEVN